MLFRSRNIRRPTSSTTLGRRLFYPRNEASRARKRAFNEPIELEQEERLECGGGKSLRAYHVHSDLLGRSENDARGPRTTKRPQPTRTLGHSAEPPSFDLSTSSTATKDTYTMSKPAVTTSSVFITIRLLTQIQHSALTLSLVTANLVHASVLVLF